MHPVGFYDLRDACRQPGPRRLDRVPPDRRGRAGPQSVPRLHLDADAPRTGGSSTPSCSARLETFLRPAAVPARTAGPRRPGRSRRRPARDDADRFLDLATAAFELSPEPVDRAWYTGWKHLRRRRRHRRRRRDPHQPSHPSGARHRRALRADADARHHDDRRDPGAARWDGPDVLLRQTSFRALAEPRRFREPDGTHHRGTPRVRFGEVEARGIALTPAGPGRYDAAARRGPSSRLCHAGARRHDVARACGRTRFPRDRGRLAAAGPRLLHLPRGRRPRPAAAGPRRPRTSAAVERGWVVREPIVYEDFLPAPPPASSSPTSRRRFHGAQDGTRHRLRQDWLRALLDADVADPMALYEDAARSRRLTRRAPTSSGPTTACPLTHRDDSPSLGDASMTSTDTTSPPTGLSPLARPRSPARRRSGSTAWRRLPAARSPARR